MALGLTGCTLTHLERLEAEAILLLLSEKGVCASAGSACSSGSLEPSRVLRAMQVPDPLAHGAIRFSLSRFTTDDEIDAAALEALCRQYLTAYKVPVAFTKVPRLLRSEVGKLQRAELARRYSAGELDSLASA